MNRSASRTLPPLRRILTAILLAAAVAPGRAGAGASGDDPLAEARGRLARGDARAALTALEPLLTRAEELDRLDREGRLATALVLRATAATAASQRQLALRSFSEVLAVEPGWRPASHPGGVPPAAAQLFDEVLGQSGTRPPLLLRPSRGEAEGEVAIKLHDPKGAVAHLVLHARPAGERRYEKSPFRGGIWGAPHQQARIPTFDGLASAQPYVLEYHVEGLSFSGDTLIRLGAPSAPLRLPRVAPVLVAGAPAPGIRWYQRRWVWILAGVVVVGAVVGSAVAATRGSSGNPSGSGLVLLRY